MAQELSLAPALSVLDNIWLGNREVPLFHRRKELRDRARAALDKLGLTELSLDTPASALSIGRRQLVEIARMLTRNARVLILDEPTATLSDVEIERIFAALRTLKAEGKSVVYITHRLGEVFDVCDSVSVLRNGELVGTRAISEIDRPALMQMMLGRSMSEMYPRWDSKPGEAMLEVRELCVVPLVQGFNLTAERGTVTCLAGQVGSGAIKVLRALAGLTAGATGEVRVSGAPMRLRSVSRAQAAAVQFISEDRAGEGIFLRLNARAEPGRHEVARTHAARRPPRAGCAPPRRNSLPPLASTVRGCARRPTNSAAATSKSSRSAAGPAAIDPGVLLMNEPTRGVDVGARAEIYRLIRQFCDRGYCIVMASSDIEEVLGMADVVVSMYRGRQVALYRRGAADMQRVLADITHPAVAA